MDVLFFQNLAYSLFPQGIRDDDPAYTRTLEHQKLLSLLQQAKSKERNWNILLDSLTPLDCRDIGIPDPIERDFRTVIILQHPKPHGIILTVSRLIPYYIFYTESGLEDVKFSDPGFFIFSGFSKSDQQIIDQVIEKIQIHFAGYERFPSSLLDMELFDVVLEDKGKLRSETYRRYWTPLTLYNAFFGSHFFN